MSYKSPIAIVQEQIVTEFENNVLKSVHSVGINVDKEELIQALKHDRRQYDVGYVDALNDVICLLEKNNIIIFENNLEAFKNEIEIMYQQEGEKYDG